MVDVALQPNRVRRYAIPAQARQFTDRAEAESTTGFLLCCR